MMDVNSPRVLHRSSPPPLQEPHWLVVCLLARGLTGQQRHLVPGVDQAAVVLHRTVTGAHHLLCRALAGQHTQAVRVRGACGEGGLVERLARQRPGGVSGGGIHGENDGVVNQEGAASILCSQGLRATLLDRNIVNTLPSQGHLSLTLISLRRHNLSFSEFLSRNSSSLSKVLNVVKKI